MKVEKPRRRRSSSHYVKCRKSSEHRQLFHNCFLTVFLWIMELSFISDVKKQTTITPIMLNSHT